MRFLEKSVLVTIEVTMTQMRGFLEKIEKEERSIETFGLSREHFSNSWS